MFTATLFRTAKTWKEPKCPPVDEWIHRDIYTREYYLAIQKEGNSSICDNMDEPRRALC